MVMKPRKFSRMTLILGFLVITLIGFGVLGIEKSSASVIVTVDQSYLTAAIPYPEGLAADFGQSFTPTLTGIDAIEFRMSGGGSPVVNLRTGGGLTGTIVATSNAPSVNAGIFHFDFPSTVNLTPGNIYTAQVDVTSVATFYYGNNGYANGESYLPPGPPGSSYDLWFSEGLHEVAVVPIPAAVWLLGSGLIGIVGIRRKIR